MKNQKFKNQRGVAIVEYALLTALIAIVAVSALRLVQDGNNRVIGEAATVIDAGRVNGCYVGVNGEVICNPELDAPRS